MLNRRQFAAASISLTTVGIAGCTDNNGLEDPEENAIERNEHRIGWFDPGRINEQYDEGNVQVEPGKDFDVRITDVSFEDGEVALRYVTLNPLSETSLEVITIARSLYSGIVDSNFEHLDDEGNETDEEIKSFAITIHRQGTIGAEFSVSGDWLKDYFNNMMDDNLDAIEEQQDEILERYETFDEDSDR